MGNWRTGGTGSAPQVTGDDDVADAGERTQTFTPHEVGGDPPSHVSNRTTVHKRLVAAHESSTQNKNGSSSHDWSRRCDIPGRCTCALPH